MTAKTEARNVARKLRRIEEGMFTSNANYGIHGPKAAALWQTVLKAAVMAETLAEEVSDV